MARRGKGCCVYFSRSSSVYIFKINPLMEQTKSGENYLPRTALFILQATTEYFKSRAMIYFISFLNRHNA
jgi:hypothetical protein